MSPKNPTPRLTTTKPITSKVRNAGITKRYTPTIDVTAAARAIASALAEPWHYKTTKTFAIAATPKPSHYLPKQGGPKRLVPFLNTPHPTPIFPTTYDKPEITSVEELDSLLRRDLAFYSGLHHELRWSRLERDVYMQNQMADYVQILLERLGGGQEGLRRYRERDRDLKDSDIPKKLRTRLLKVNFRNCLARRDWRNVEEEV